MGYIRNVSYSCSFKGHTLSISIYSRMAVPTAWSQLGGFYSEVRSDEQSGTWPSQHRPCPIPQAKTEEQHGSSTVHVPSCYRVHCKTLGSMYVEGTVAGSFESICNISCPEASPVRCQTGLSPRAALHSENSGKAKV